MKVERIHNTYLATDMSNKKKKEKRLDKEAKEDFSKKPFECFLQESVSIYEEEKEM